MKLHLSILQSKTLIYMLNIFSDEMFPNYVLYTLIFLDHAFQPYFCLPFDVLLYVPLKIITVMHIMHNNKYKYVLFIITIVSLVV